MLATVRQTTDFSCFAASVAMVTGLDYDLFDLSYEAAPTVYPSVIGMTMDPNEAIVWHPDDTTIVHWGELLNSLGYEMETYLQPIHGREGILTITIVNAPGVYWSHAVAVEKSGHIVCPSATFDEMHLTDLLDACNIFVSGFFVIKEKE